MVLTIIKKSAQLDRTYHLLFTEVCTCTCTCTCVHVLVTFQNKVPIIKRKHLCRNWTICPIELNFTINFISNYYYFPVEFKISILSDGTKIVTPFCNIPLVSLIYILGKWALYLISFLLLLFLIKKMLFGICKTYLLWKTHLYLNKMIRR